MPDPKEPRARLDKDQLALVKELVGRELARVPPIPAMTARKVALEGVLHSVMDLEQELLGSPDADRRRRASVKPDAGLEEEFLQAVSDELAAMGIESEVDYPGILVFEAHGRRWATGRTGLHVSDAEGHGDHLPGDRHLVALEEAGGVTVGQVADTIKAIAARQVSP